MINTLVFKSRPLVLLMIRLSKSLIISFCLLNTLNLQAQVNDSIQVKEITQIEVEDGWIEKMNNNIGLDVSLNNSYETFEVQTETNRFVLYPNTPSNLRLKLNYRFITIGFKFSPDFLPGNGDEELKGNTKSFSIGTALVFKHWFFDLSYSQVKGFYLENSDEYIASFQDEPYIQFPDLNYKGFAIGSGYYNNSRFSFRSLTSQTERQLKSAGSFIPVFNFRYFEIDDQSTGLVTQKSNNIEASIGPGYAYTFVAKEKFYLSLALQANLGYLNTKLTTRFQTGDEIIHQDNFIFRWDGKTGIGYNGSKYYTGLYTTLSGTQYRQENTTAINFETRVFYHLFFGVRLKSPKFLEKNVTKLENKFHKE